MTPGWDLHSLLDQAGREMREREARRQTAVSGAFEKLGMPEVPSEKKVETRPVQRQNLPRNSSNDPYVDKGQKSNGARDAKAHKYDDLGVEMRPGSSRRPAPTATAMARGHQVDSHIDNGLALVRVDSLEGMDGEESLSPASQMFVQGGTGPQHFNTTTGPTVQEPLSLHHQSGDFVSTDPHYANRLAHSRQTAAAMRVRDNGRESNNIATTINFGSAVTFGVYEDPYVVSARRQTQREGMPQPSLTSSPNGIPLTSPAEQRNITPLDYRTNNLTNPSPNGQPLYPYSNIDPYEPDPEDRSSRWELWALHLLIKDRMGLNDGDIRAYLAAEYDEAVKRKPVRMAMERWTEDDWAQWKRGYSTCIEMLR